MRFTRLRLLAVLAAALMLPSAAAAQIGINPRIGIYVPAGSFAELESQLESIEIDKEAAFTIGVTVEFGRFYAGFDYVTGSTISADGLQNGDDLGDGSMLGVAGGFLLRAGTPLLQPHLKLGAGVKRQTYSYNDEDFGFPDDDTELTLHAALGLSLLVGGIGITAELADYMTLDGFEPNDLILSVGLRIGF